MSAIWLVENKEEKGKWQNLKLEDSTKIEEEYQQWIKKGKMDSFRVYHCFGNKWSAIIDFDQMQTCCGSGRCMGSHDSPTGEKEDHMAFKLQRVYEV